MNHPSPGVRERIESPSAVLSLFDNNPSVFQLLFERSADAIWLFDPQAGELLGHIFTNLLSNAVKYSEPGVTVHFLVERDGSDAVCVIRDQGIGIPEEDQQQLFKAFHRGSNVRTRPGTGLGLMLVKRCVDLHGGKVQVVSKFGEGTTVTMKFSALQRK